MSESVRLSEQNGRAVPVGEKPSRKKTPFWVWAVVAAGVSGGLMAACYWPLNLWFLAWFAMVPWMLVLPRLKPGLTWAIGILLGLVFYRFSLGWLFELHGPIGGATIVVFSILMGFSFRVARLLMDRFGTHAMLWALPITFVGQEVVRCEGLPLLRFAYAAWGYSQAQFVWVAQIASIGGVYFITFVLVAFNAAVAYGLIRRCLKAWLPAGVLAVVVLVLAAVSQPGSYDDHARIPVACIQAETNDLDVYEALCSAAAEHNPRPRFVVLPEHTIVDVLSDDARHSLIKSLAKLGRDHGSFFCVGAHSKPRDGGECYYDNVGLLLGSDGRIILRQVKVVPVPFYSDGNPGRQLDLAETPYGFVAVPVCYDTSFTDVPRRAVAMGAELLLCPIFNALSWPDQQQWQQMDMAAIRSIELRRCVIRAASSGVSMIVEATGRASCLRTREDGQGILYGEVYAVDEKTLFVRGGYLFPAVVTCAFLGIVVVLQTLLEWLGY